MGGPTGTVMAAVTNYCPRNLCEIRDMGYEIRVTGSEALGLEASGNIVFTGQGVSASHLASAPKDLGENGFCSNGD